MLVAYIEWKLVASMPTVYDRGYRMDKKQEYLHEGREVPNVRHAELLMNCMM